MMRRLRNSLTSDIAYLLFIGACLILIMFMSSDSGHQIKHLIFVNATFLIAIITYFTTIITGLILNLVFVFGYGSYTIYIVAGQGEILSLGDYFWLVMTPLITLLVWLLTQSNRLLQEENDRLLSQNSALATIDETTKLKNTLSYQHDMNTFMALSERYNIPLTMLVINIKFWDEIKRIMSADKFTNVLMELSDVSQSIVRTNDILYLLSNEPPTWGIVLFTDEEGAEIVMKRLKDRINELNELEYKEKYNASIHLRIGTAQYNKAEPVSPLELVAQAKRKMEYDV